MWFPSSRKKFAGFPLEYAFSVTVIARITQSRFCALAFRLGYVHPIRD